MLATFFICVCIGFAIGILSGLLGVGGGMVMLPLFRLVFGMSPVGATATSLFTIIPTSVSGALGHVRAKTCIPRLGIALGVGGACTSWIGVRVAQISPGWLVICASAVVIGFAGFSMLRKALSLPRDEDKTADVAVVEESADAFRNELSKAAVGKAVLVGAVAGILSGYVGLGGGFIMIPMMVLVLGIPMRMASGTSLIAVMILALPATVLQCALGNVDYLAGIAMSCGTVPGALVGARLIKRAPERSLRLMFSVFLGLAAVVLMVNELGILG